MWQPIETAPKDGEIVRLKYFNHAYVGLYKPRNPEYPWVILDSMEEDGTNALSEGSPTHWMPLPPVPDNAVVSGPTTKVQDDK